MKNTYIRNSGLNSIEVLCVILLLVVLGISVLLLTRLQTDGNGSTARGPVAIHLVEEFKPENVKGTQQETVTVPPRTEWRFGGFAPSPSGEPNSATGGWRVFEGVADLHVRDGRLVGHCTSASPRITVEMPSRPDDTDLLHSIEIRMCSSAGAYMGIGCFNDSNHFVGLFGTPIIGDGEIRTYAIKSRWSPAASKIKHVRIGLPDANEATFEIEYVRLIFRKEYLASIPSGVNWQSLSKIYRQTMIAQTSEVIQFPLTLPDQPWLDLAIGTIEDGPVTFQVKIRLADEPTEGVALLRRTITTPHRWEPVKVDLSEYARQDVILSLSLAGQKAGTLGFWGSPVIRNNGAIPRPFIRENGAFSRETPQGVILIWADDLRWDHLDVYGYSRQTAPVLRQMAEEGTLFHDCLSQAPWTLPSTVSLLTSLYVTTHGVYAEGPSARLSLPASATTLAEVFHQAGYATLSFVSMQYAGGQYNLDQGFEELHEYNSAVEFEWGGISRETSREYVGRLLGWLEDRREVPFFVFLHLLDPHAPFKPYPPYDTLWADPTTKKKHEVYVEKLGGLHPSLEEVEKAGIDPDDFIAARIDLYDGSIRAMDTEIGRLFERLEELGLDEKTLVIFCSDHGEEFYDHGKLGHHGAYSEVTHVPLIIRWPTVIPEGIEVFETIRTIDLMPTILELCRLPVPQAVQGQSLLPLFDTAKQDTDESVAMSDRNAASTAVQWRKEPAVCEHLRSEREKRRNPKNRDSYAIILDGWKLNVYEPQEGDPEYELYDHRKDPLDQVNLADKHPEIVERLAEDFKAWKEKAAAARLAPDSEIEKQLTSEQLQHLRSLGYLR
jgi:arylsulfatase A-like enzyme